MARQPTVRDSLLGAGESIQAQFRGLRSEDGAFWPVLPRYLLFTLVALVALALAWFVWLQSVDADLRRVRAQEPALKAEYGTKLGKAVNLDALKQRKAQVTQYVTVLEKQLPGKAEMDALLSDINQAGLGRSLQFNLFKPGAVLVRDYYAELPISLVISGRFHDIGTFAGDIAGLSRIVTLSDLTITPAKAGETVAGLAHPDALILHATARTYRYLDPEEIASQKTAKTQTAGKK